MARQGMGYERSVKSLNSGGLAMRFQVAERDAPYRRQPVGRGLIRLQTVTKGTKSCSRLPQQP
jgi:hypothetical protein